MTPPEILSRHLQLCAELHTLALEENNHLRLHAGPTTPAHAARKRDLLARLDESLATLRDIPAGRDANLRPGVEKARARTLQVLELTRENEQLLLRASLSRGTSTTPSAPPALLRSVYGGAA